VPAHRDQESEEEEHPGKVGTPGDAEGAEAADPTRDKSESGRAEVVRSRRIAINAGNTAAQTRMDARPVAKLAAPVIA
jgi:hypothetical protein